MEKILIRGAEIGSWTGKVQKEGAADRFVLTGDLSFEVAEELGIADHFFDIQRDDDGAAVRATPRESGAEIKAGNEFPIEAITLQPTAAPKMNIEIVANHCEWDAYTIAPKDEDGVPQPRIQVRITMPFEAGNRLRAEALLPWMAGPYLLKLSPVGAQAGEAQPSLDLGEGPKRGRKRKVVPMVDNVAATPEAEE